MEKSKNSINVEGGFLFCGGWNFSKSVSAGEMRDESNYFEKHLVLRLKEDAKMMLFH